MPIGNALSKTVRRHCQSMEHACVLQCESKKRACDVLSVTNFQNAFFGTLDWEFAERSVNKHFTKPQKLRESKTRLMNEVQRTNEQNIKLKIPPDMKYCPNYTRRVY